MVDPFKFAEQVAADPFALADQLAAQLSTGASAGGRGVNVGRTAIGNFWGGEKFIGGFGDTFLNIPDYYSLRTRSSQLFSENLFARGLIRRLVTNEINTGLKLQADPNSELIDTLDEEGAEDWAEEVENRFEIWATTPKLCDYEGNRTFAQLQEDARREALIEGDVLVHLRTDRRTGLPQIQLIRGGRVVTPLKLSEAERKTIVNGVELDSRGRQVAYHVQRGGTFLDTERIPAFGPRSGRRMSWLLYGSDKRMDAVRGMPLLGILLQSLKEIDRYRDSEQRAAVVNSMLAMFLEKQQNLPGTRPMSGGAIRRAVVSGDSETTGVTREFTIGESIPGVVFEELQQGEIPHSFNTSRPNVNYAAFETAVLTAIAWASEIPPEVLTLGFNSNYSASKAAISEFNSYISKTRRGIGSMLCQPIYVEWLNAEVLSFRLEAPGYLEARANPTLYVEAGAWVRAQWSGPVKASIDLGKDVKAYVEAIKSNLTTATRAAEDLFGNRFLTVVKRRLREQRAVREMNEELGISNDPQPVAAAPDGQATPSDETVEMIVNLVAEEMEDRYGSNLIHSH